VLRHLADGSNVDDALIAFSPIARIETFTLANHLGLSSESEWTNAAAKLSAQKIDVTGLARHTLDASVERSARARTATPLFLPLVVLILLPLFIRTSCIFEGLITSFS